MLNNRIYVLPKSVFFTASRDQVYARNVDTRKNYLLAGSAYDILSILRTPHDMASLVAKLKKDYRLDDEDDFITSISSFINSLLIEGLLRDAGKDDNVEVLGGNRNNIEEMLRQQAVEDQRLWSVCFELTYRCNERCVHCYLDDPTERSKDKELSFKDWKMVIDECAALGCMNVLVTGGEPTLHSDFIDICRYVVDKGLLLNIYTNGLYIDDAIFDALCAMKLNSVSVSLYGGTPTFHDSITGVPGSFERTLMTAMKFKCAGKDTFIKAVVFRGHVDDYVQLKKLGERIGMTVAPSPVITAGHSGRSKSGLVVTDDEFRRLLRVDETLGINCDCIEGRNVEDPVCMAGQNTLSFDPYGNIFPCNAVLESVGNIHESSISDVWGKSEKLKWIRGIRLADLSESCATCGSLKVCAHCLGADLAENGGKPGLFQPSCRQAKIRHEEWRRNFVRECGQSKTTNKE